MKTLPTLLTRFVLAAVIFMAASCAGPSQKPASGWFGNVYLGGERDSFDAQKVFIVNFEVDDKGARSADMLIAYGVPSRLPGGQDAMRVELLDAGGGVIATIATGDPREAIIEKQGNEKLVSGMLTVRFAFDPAAKRVRLRDASGKSLAETDLDVARADFCRRNAKDPICAPNGRQQPAAQ